MNLGLAGSYSSRGSDAVKRVLIELGQVLGEYRDALVIVGGSVPYLLLTEAEPRHIGTLDVDINLDPAKLSGGRYATLVTLLEDNGYERGESELGAFQMRRRVKSPDGAEVAVILDLLMPAGSKTKKNRPPLKENLRVQQIDGGRFSLFNFRTVTLEGTMPDGRKNQTSLQVADFPAFLVMKGYALNGRNKYKDAYDIWFVIRNYPEGIEALAKECRTLLGESEAVEAYTHIADKWRRLDDFGPETVRRFLTESEAMGDFTPDQLQQDAFQVVRVWLERIGVAPQQLRTTSKAH